MTGILIVDDEVLILYSLSRTFSHCGAEVTAVESGAAALELIRKGTYELCFLDVQLPDANGLELMMVIRKLSPATKVIIMTANELTDEQLHTIASQDCVFLPKPFDLKDAQALAAITPPNHIS